MRVYQRPKADRGFTLIELLVVIFIILLVSVVTLPTIIPAYNHRQIGESARILQAALVGARDSAIRANAPRGIRLLRDPVFNNPTQMLGSNRWVAIEPAPDYSEGRVLVYTPQVDLTGNVIADYNLPLIDPTTVIGLRNPGFLPPLSARLVVVEAKLQIPLNPPAGFKINENYAPTSWFWNIRQGDRIRFGDSGNYYTIVGPMLVGGATNPERYINYGPSSNVSTPFGFFTEFLYLLNGLDDDNDGFIDEACDGLDNDGDGVIDPGYNGIDDDGINGVDDPGELLYSATGFPAGGEYEKEAFIGVHAHVVSGQTPTHEYTIYRRPVISPGTKEVTLPADVVIDMTSWNAPAAVNTKGGASPSLPERSRLPVDPFTLNVDIMINPNGSVASGGIISSSTLAFSPISSLPFYHFWLTERQDVYPTLFGSYGVTGRLLANTSYPTPTYMMPMPEGTPNYAGSVFLKGERRLVTLFTRTGQIVTNEISRDPFVLPLSGKTVGGSFDGLDTNSPYYDAQIGAREAK